MKKIIENGIRPQHYEMPITPVEFIMANNLGFCEGNVVKYVSRHSKKNGKEDLLKARTYLDILIEQYDNPKIYIKDDLED